MPGPRIVVSATVMRWTTKMGPYGMDVEFAKAVIALAAVFMITVQIGEYLFQRNSK